jgi:hypothetical protein
MSRLHVRKRSGKVVLERSEGVASCRRFRLTSFAGAYTHYVTRNRTQGLDSFPFFSALDRSRTSFAVVFLCGSPNGKGVFLVVARVRLLMKPPLLAVCLCEHVASSTSYLVPVTGTACFTFNMERQRRPVHARGGQHLVLEEMWCGPIQTGLCQPTAAKKTVQPLRQ